MKEPVYLDYNATAPLLPDALKTMEACHGLPLNASAVHRYGREGRKIIEKARAQIAALVGADAGNVIFNSGASEGSNTVFQHFKGRRILVSAIEHPCVLEALPDVEKIPVTNAGVIDLQALEDLLKQEPAPALVAVMLVNNETGIIQPIQDVSNLSRKYGAALLCDAVQAAGRIPVDINDLGVDYMLVSGHKLGGPQGVGALVMGYCGEPPVLLHGGGQEKKVRAGTENVAGIAGFGAAADVAARGLQDYQSFADLRDHLEREIAALTPAAMFFGQNQERVSNTSLFALPGVKSETLMMALDLEGICVSNGSACTSGKVEASHVLKAMGAADDQALGAIRISMGRGTSSDHIERFLKAWQKCTARL